MPVLVEGATWIVRKAAADARALALRARRCADGELVALSFDDPLEARLAGGVLEDAGLAICREDGAFEDAALVHHRLGPAGWCPWLELAAVALPGGGRVLAARAAGTARTEVAVPEGWKFEGSVTARRGVCPLSAADRPLRFVRRDPGAAVYVDRFAGDEVLVALPPPVRVTVETAAGARHEVLADVAADPRSVELGLMHRERLDPQAGMLFRFGRDAPRSFWMKNTLVPLDLLFVRSDGVVVNVVERARPLTLDPCRSREPCAAVLEVNGGWAAARGVRAGDRVAF